jgi:hypothetical protein
MRGGRVLFATRGWWLGAAMFASGCGAPPVAVTPLRGPAPKGVLVLPPQDDTGAGRRDARDLAWFADRALQERGYRALPLDVGFDLARRFGPGPGQPLLPADLLRLGRAAAVDAVLTIDVAAFETEGSRPLQSAQWDVAWTLVGVADAAPLWQYRGRGTWHRAPPDPGDLMRPIDAEPEVVPVGGMRPRDFRDERELAATLHRDAMARLPRREP